ncbi:MAG: hypothetical protein IPN94_02510 [Sphingobacteriales bacterium]|nr:hypothetical protein [Sphingobacteriales bacterium]
MQIEQYREETSETYMSGNDVVAIWAGCFCRVADSSGRIQLYIQRDEICPADDVDKLLQNVFKKLLDNSDYIGITGYKFKTKVGEIILHVKSFAFLPGKALSRYLL